MTDTSRSYHVRAVLSTGGLWQGSVDELPEVQGTHRSLSALEKRIQAGIERHLGQGGDSDPAGFELELIPSTGDPEFDSQLTEARDLRRRANVLVEQARAAAAPLARRLVAAGVSTRDAGSLLDVSGSLIHGMLKDKPQTT